VGKSDESPKISSEIAVDTPSRPHYNTPAYPRYRLLTSRLTDQGLAYEERACFLILPTSHDDMLPSSHPFFGETATPDPQVSSSPGGGASPQSTLMPCFQRSAILAELACDASATATHASVKGGEHVYGFNFRFETTWLERSEGQEVEKKRLWFRGGPWP
jgi:hypothetical protein